MNPAEPSVYVVDDPLSSVAYGTGKVLEEIETLRRVLMFERKENLTSLD